MLILKRTLLVLITSLFTTLLFTTAWTEGVVRSVGSPEPVKKTLSDSGIYSTLISSFLNQAKTSSSSNGDVSLTDPIIQKAATQTFTPQILQRDTETILDSTYQWLNGAVAKPDFKIDLSSVKTSFANNVSTALQAQLQTLPVCPTNMNNSNFDALTATCLPKGTTAASAAAKVKDNLLSGKGFLENPVITADNVKQNGSSQSAFADQYKKIPGYFQKAKMAPLLFGSLAILSAIAIVFLSATRMKGVRHISFTLLFVGILMLVFAWGANYLLNQKLLPKIKIDNNQVLQDKVQVLAKDLTAQIDKNYWIFGGTYTGLAVAGLASPLVVSRLQGRKSGPKTPKPVAEPKAPEEPKPEIQPEKPAEPKKRTIDIQ